MTFYYWPNSTVVLNDPIEGVSEPDKPQDDAGCTGGLPTGTDNYIIAVGKEDCEDVLDGENLDKVYFRGTRSRGESFTADQRNAEKDDFESETTFCIWNSKADYDAGDAAVQQINYHTSCSQFVQCGLSTPGMNRGDQICSLIFTRFFGDDQPPDLPGCLAYPGEVPDSSWTCEPACSGS